MTETAAAPEAAVRQAIVEAVRGRMGREADVRVEELRVNVEGAPERSGRGEAPVTAARLVARPEPGARLARSIRFSLARPSPEAGRRSAGYAVATVFVVLTHARAARPIGRGETVSANDLATTRAEVGPVLLQPLPAVSEIVGTRALRDVAPDEVLTRTVVGVRPTVRSGDEVSIQAAEAGVTARTRGVAEQSGGVGETIRVVNPSSRRAVKARVLAPGKVEVVQ